ncbi:MAG: peptidoglycan DD-metalloendopeptidase family protein [Bacilli bacterium]|nr:peptidoglycan DD-metalloendopeptidase family protein [Bacilli bacterium]
MKKVIVIFVVFISVFTCGFGYSKNTTPNTFYQIYLNEDLLGVVKSKKALEDYIDKNGEYYKRKFGVSKIYSPKGLIVKKINTYNNKVDSVSSIYKKISKKADFTILGYEFKIKKHADKDKIEVQSVYVLKKKTFSDAVNALITTFIGDDRYTAYVDDTQVNIESTGENIQSVYINEDITVRKTNIPVTEVIYTDYNDLAHFLLYGKNNKEMIYEVRAGDTVESVAFNNKISPEEVLISNVDLNSKNNLLYPGQKLKISETNPQIGIVEESYVVKDIDSQFTTEERYDNNLVVGQDRVIQEGVKGLDRVSQKVKKINGTIVYVDPRGKVVLKDPVSRIIVKGNKIVPDVGSTSSWGWPTDSGYTISSGFVWRTNPVTHRRELHGGLDISGTGYGSRIYASNNGRVEKAEYHYSFGNHVIINHNNGYLTVYAHMSRIAVKKGDVVSRGQVIGYVGMTGVATGPHLHYEIWRGCNYCRINPMTMYR